MRITKTEKEKKLGRKLMMKLTMDIINELQRT